MSGRFLIPLILCVAGVAARTVYELLKKEGRIDTRSAVVLSTMVAMMTAFLTSWVFMCPNDPLHVYAGKAARWIGHSIAFAGVCLAAGGLARLKKVENVDHLVTTGLFARIRHPMYTGFIAWISGWVICFGSATSAAVAVFCIGNILYWRLLEERALELRYGEEYRRYRERTLF
jgi:protein-S-isoprenylcysteine O-methyltransferase Ste14